MKEKRIHGMIKVARRDFGKVYGLYFLDGKLKVDRTMNIPLSCSYSSDGIVGYWIVEEGLMILFSGIGDLTKLREKRPPEVKYLRVSCE